MKQYGLTCWRLMVLALLVQAQAQTADADRQARVVAVRPAAQAAVGETTTPVRKTARLAPGTRLETDPHGQIALLLPDYLLLKVAPETRFTYLGPQGGQNRGQLDKGKVWLRGRKKRTPMTVRTPTATAAIRGTEWYMEVGPDGTTVVGVLDGEVAVENDLGAVALGAREVARVEPGKAPQKMAYLTPADAVNWTLRYRGLWSAKDIDSEGAAFASLARQVLAAYYRNDLAGAAQTLAKARATQGEGAAWLALQGFLDLVGGKTEAAGKAFTAAAQKRPDWALPASHLALAALVEGRLPVAQAHIAEARAIEPDSPVTLTVAALVSKAERNVDHAWQLSRQAVAQAPGFAEGRLAAATVALEAGRRKACGHLLAGLPDLTDRPGLAAERDTLLGFLALQEARSAEALDHFTAATRLDPEHPDAHVGLGIALCNAGRTAAGLDALARATLMAPQVSSYQSYLAKGFYELGRNEDARAALARAKRLDPKDPTPYLYESLLEFSRHRPGFALLQLTEATARNDNRAVLRGRYLLDQDAAVLMNNTASILNALGFERTATRTSAAAMETDPANEGAHRNFYFALLQDPRLFYQAAFSERVIAGLFAPPTRQGVVLDDDYVSSYQEVFDRPGLDGVLYSSFYTQQSERILSQSRIPVTATDTDNIQEQYVANVSGKFKAPLAASLTVGKGMSRLGVKSRTTNASAFSTTITEVDVPQDQDSYFIKCFAKWRPLPDLDLSVDFDQNRTWTVSDTDTETQMHFAFPGIPPNVSTSESTSEVETSRDMLSLGARYRFGNDLNLLCNAVIHDRGFENLSETLSFFPTTTISTSDYDQDILQAALLLPWRQHRFWLGFRDADTKDWTDTTSQTGTFAPTYTETGHDVEATQLYTVNRLHLHPKLDITLGVFAHDLTYSLRDGREYSDDFIDPVAGLQWRLTPCLTFRAAYVESLSGDGGERLQPTTIAGFPTITTSLIDTFNAEDMLVLEHTSRSVALDFNPVRWPFYCGVEAGDLLDNTSHFDPAGSEKRLRTRVRGKEVTLYAETLITPRLSVTGSLRHTVLDIPDKHWQQSYNAEMRYAFDWGLALALEGEYWRRGPDADSATLDEEVKETLTPSLRWYGPHDWWKLDVEGSYERSQRTSITTPGEAQEGRTWQTRVNLTVYF